VLLLGMERRKARASFGEGTVPYRRRQDAGHVLHDKKPRPQLAHYVNEIPKEVPSIVVQRSTPAGRTETLAARATGNEGWAPPTQLGCAPDVPRLNILNPLGDYRKVRPVRRNRRGSTLVRLHGDVQLETTALKAKVEAKGP
jgi:hypothetical protein